MRFRVRINGQDQFTASLPRAGFLSAHLNLYDRPKEGERTQSLSVKGFDTSNPTDTVALEWPKFSLGASDIVELQLLADGPGDEPQSKRRTSGLPTNLLTDRALAEATLTLVKDFEAALWRLMESAESIEPPDEHRKFLRAVASVATHLGEDLISPIQRRHTDLIPEADRGERL